MAKFLNTRKAVSEIEDLIRTANEKLILISPYLKISKDFKELLTFRNKSDKITTIVFGKQALNPDELEFIESLRFVILKYNENLHAKCYVNDHKMIISSLNLYDFSMANNKEMGVLIDNNSDADKEVFNDAMNEIDYILKTSESFEISLNKESSKKTNKPSASKDSKKHYGYCIRTGVPIPFNINKPFSIEAFKIWAEYSDDDYPEKFCHLTGEPSDGDTSKSHPILLKNWGLAKQLKLIS